MKSSDHSLPMSPATADAGLSRIVLTPQMPARGLNESPLSINALMPQPQDHRGVTDSAATAVEDTHYKGDRGPPKAMLPLEGLGHPALRPVHGFPRAPAPFYG